jgi:flagellar biosynthesis component FlhA
MSDALTPHEAARLATANRKLAEEKIREDIRNAVRAEMMKDGFSRYSIEKAAKDTLMDLVRDQVEKAFKGSVFKTRLDEIIQQHIKEAFGKADVSKTLKELLVEQARAAATKFVAERVVVDVRSEDFGSF